MKFQGCQLAEHAETVPTTGYPLIAQPKLDGFRILCHIDPDGAYTFFTRGAKSEPYTANLAHIGEALVKLGFRGCVVDGEAVAAKSWNRTASLLRSHPTPAGLAEIREHVVYTVFDIFYPAAISETPMGGRSRAARRTFEMPYTERRALLRDALQDDFNDGSPVRLVPEWTIYNAAEATKLLEEFLDLGYEGIMLKQPSAPYVFDRWVSWLAIKPSRTLDAKVVSVNEGGGRHAGRMGSLTVEMADGVQFNVGTGFSDEERTTIWAASVTVIGRWVEVTVQATDVSVCRHPAFGRWRTDRD